jgi:hypothetical protein
MMLAPGRQWGCELKTHCSGRRFLASSIHKQERYCKRCGLIACPLCKPHHDGDKCKCPDNAFTRGGVDHQAYMLQREQEKQEEADQKAAQHAAECAESRRLVRSIFMCLSNGETECQESVLIRWHLLQACKEHLCRNAQTDIHDSTRRLLWRR